MLSNYVRYLLREFISTIFFIFGGVILIKHMYKEKSVLIILNYHNFSKYNNYRINRGSILEIAYVKNFEKQIRFLNKYFHFSYPDEFIQSNNQLKGINILITFDDGYKDNYEIALPILKRNNASAIFFITTNYIGTSNWLWHDKVRYLSQKNPLIKKSSGEVLKSLNSGIPIPQDFEREIENSWFSENPKIRLMMSWEEVRLISKSGFIIGSHTNNHRRLSLMKGKVLESEITSSLQKVDIKLNLKCRYFAYPNGLFNEETLAILENSNIDFGFTTKAGINFVGQNPKLLRRIGINASDSIPVLALKILLKGNYGLKR